MTMINNNIFQSIKSALAQSNTESGIGNILKTEVGNTYTVRLLPAKDPKNTFFHFFTHGWNSYATGKYVSATSPQTFGERDPISEERFRVLRSGTDAEKAKIKTIGRSEKWLVNVLVINDPVNATNNGQVKLLRYGKQIQKIILDAIEGEDADELGARIFDLGPNGVNLKIKVEAQGEYPSYVSSKFSMPSAIADMDEAKAKKIYDSVYDLTKVFTIKSYDELKAMLDEHFYCTTVKDEVDVVTPDATKPTPVYAAKPVAVTTTATNTTNDDEINSLLKELDASN